LVNKIGSSNEKEYIKKTNNMYSSKILAEEPSSLTNSQKFIRREDLCPLTRLKIALIGQFFKRHGTITRLAKRHDISRVFVYVLINQLSEYAEDLFGEIVALRQKEQLQAREEDNLHRLLRYRLIGTCSLGKCSELLHQDQALNTSVGWCSETLEKMGSLLDNTVDWQGQAVFASDEIYYIEHRPILVTVEPISGAILRIDLEPNLTKQGWERHWEGLRQQGITPLLLVRDEGHILKAAQESLLTDVAYQPDTFHAITHRLCRIEQQLEKQACHAIGHEYEREKIAQQAVSKKVISKKKKAYQESQDQAAQALDTLASFSWLYHYSRHQLRIIRSDGSLRARSHAEAEVQAALDLMRTLPVKGIKEVITQIEKVLPDLFGFLDRAIDVVKHLHQQLPPEIVPFYLLYWQQCRAYANVKSSQHRQRIRPQIQWLEEFLQQESSHSQRDFLIDRALVFAHMDGVIQSSAMVECANSRLRPFIREMRGQLSHATLNLIMFYHNHCPFKRGKRKGKAPIELLSGQPLEKDWLTLLLDKVRPQLRTAA